MTKHLSINPQHKTRPALEISVSPRSSQWQFTTIFVCISAFFYYVFGVLTNSLRAFSFECALFLIIEIVMGLFTFLVWTYADAVYDYGDHLIVTRRGREDRIMFNQINDFREIFNIEHLSDYFLIAITLDQECKFGQTIRFISHFTPTQKNLSINKTAEDIKRRIRHARAGCVHF